PERDSSLPRGTNARRRTNSRRIREECGTIGRGPVRASRPAPPRLSMALQQGQVLDGKYRIVRVIGEGGMGAVYEGENTRIRRRVAIKILHAGIAANTEMVQRF